MNIFSWFAKRVIIGYILLFVSLVGASTRATPLFAQSAVPQLSFSPSSITAEVGSSVTVEVILDTAGESVGGVGAKMKYDPALIEIQSIETLPLFPDYPTTMFDNQAGTITISGVVQNIDQLITTSGSFAKITFTLKQPTATHIDFVYEPNQTTDSNIAILSGTGDALQSVIPLTVSPKEGSEQIPVSPTTEAYMQERSDHPQDASTSMKTQNADSSYWDISLIGLGVILFAITIGLHIHLTIQIRQLHEEVQRLRKKESK